MPNNPSLDRGEKIGFRLGGFSTLSPNIGIYTLDRTQLLANMA